MWSSEEPFSTVLEPVNCSTLLVENIMWLKVFALGFLGLASAFTAKAPFAPSRTCTSPRQANNMNPGVFRLFSKRSKPSTLSQELQTLAAKNFLGIGSAESRFRIDELIDELVQLRAPFATADLAGGLWVSSYNRGAREPRWRTLATALERPGPKNLSGQSYDVDEGTVLNYSEVLGQRFVLTARGTFRPAAAPSQRCPVDYDVQITGGAICFGGAPTAETSPWAVQLPINGPGFLRVLFADTNARIFVSPSDSPEK